MFLVHEAKCTPNTTMCQVGYFETLLYSSTRTRNHVDNTHQQESRQLRVEDTPLQPSCYESQEDCFCIQFVFLFESFLRLL